MLGFVIGLGTELLTGQSIIPRSAWVDRHEHRLLRRHCRRHRPGHPAHRIGGLRPLAPQRPRPLRAPMIATLTVLLFTAWLVSALLQPDLAS
ncbi:hypothetical protein KBY96_15815 [Cyanobium sp. ATX 6A2]|uniref:hypothetical protein n=1 Tax=Cyanobium sp. ATX 6A2 TaxID=2823700 RepID=UPI0020CF35AB|nr:hypothetical protein [Cyanobium sp. ATX 6A2]